MRFDRMLCGLALTAGVAGCAMPYSTPLMDPSNIPFPGIQDAFVQEPSGNRVPDVLLVHGMCTHDESNLKAANAALARALGMEPADASRVQLDLLWGGHDEAQLFTSTLTDGTDSVRTYSLLWSPIATRYKKERLCYDVSGKTASCQTPGFDKPRALANAFAKGWLDDCLADAVFYLGNDGGEALRDAVRRAVVTSLAGGPSRNMADVDQLQLAARRTAPYFIVTHSLGSKILADALFEVHNRDEGADRLLKQALARTYQVFMEANQLPVLSLGVGAVARRFDASSEVTDPAMDALAQVLRDARRSRRGPRDLADEPVAIVAFSDPNDLLSWGLRDSKVRIRHADIVDIWVSNAPSWLGLFENPLTAHVGYEVNPAVARFIACGWRVAPNEVRCPGNAR